MSLIAFRGAGGVRSRVRLRFALRFHPCVRARVHHRSRLVSVGGVRIVGGAGDRGGRRSLAYIREAEVGL